MERKIVVTAILKDQDEYLIVKRSNNDDKFPNMWEFPGGHIENNELLLDGLKRELLEEIGFDYNGIPIIKHYYDEFDDEGYNLEIDFLIEASKENIKVKLSDEHSDYKWVNSSSSLIDDYIKEKIK